MQSTSEPGDEDRDGARVKHDGASMNGNTRKFQRVLRRLRGWSLPLVLLSLCVSASGLEISGFQGNHVNCSKGLSECAMEDGYPLEDVEGNVSIKQIRAHFKLCCRDDGCSLCLVIDIDLDVSLGKDMEDEGHSGADEKDNSTTLRKDIQSAAFTVCYHQGNTQKRCKKVTFNVSHAALMDRNQAEVSMIILDHGGFPFSNHIFIDLAKRRRDVSTPSLDEVCSQDRLQNLISSCPVPKVYSSINRRTNQMELLFESRDGTPPSLCLQYEENGVCRDWTQTTIPLSSLAPCMCLQAWDKDKLHGVSPSRRTLYCPFKRTTKQHKTILDFLPDLRHTTWKNVSVNVTLRKMSDQSTMLSWNLTAPCRLDGEVRLCYKTGDCWGDKIFQQLGKNTWTQNNMGLWENKGHFQNVSTQFSSCVMVKIKNMDYEFGPVCAYDIARSHWSLLFVCLMLLVCLTALTIYCLHDVKKWVWSWHHVPRKGHIVLLSPPDMDNGVCEAVCQLGSFLCNQGFSVSVDQWSRKEQCTLGPLAWLHWQLSKIDNMGGRVLLVLTHRALERTGEWTHCSRDDEVKNPQELKSPYSDLFSGLLVLIQANKRLGAAGERFVLVKFDSHPTQHHGSDKSLPELLQGLPLFQLPSQTQSLLSELTVVAGMR